MHRLHTAASGLLLSLCTVPWQALNRNPKQISGTSMSCTRRAYRIGNSWRLLEMVGHLIMFFKCFWGGGCCLQQKLTQALCILQVKDLLKRHLAYSRMTNKMMTTSSSQACTGWGRNALAKWTTSDSSSSSNRCLETFTRRGQLRCPKPTFHTTRTSIVPVAMFDEMIDGVNIGVGRVGATVGHDNRLRDTIWQGSLDINTTMVSFQLGASVRGNLKRLSKVFKKLPPGSAS